MTLLRDRVRETTTTTGTGTVDLDGAPTTFESFVDGVGTGNTCFYCIRHTTANEWEIGSGTVTDAAPDTLSRSSVLQSSNSDALVSFSAGIKEVFIVHPAQHRLKTDSSTAFSQGSVLFIDANGDIDEDNSGLYWATSNKFLGIGTSSPTSHLHVQDGGQAANIRLETQFDSAVSDFQIRRTQTGGAALNAARDLAKFSAWGYDGSTYLEGFRIEVASTTAASAGSMSSEARFMIRKTSTFSERMRLTEDGELLLDETTPNGAKLQVKQTTANPGVFIDQDGDSVAFEIDSESATSNVLRILDAKTTTSITCNISSDTLTTGKLLQLASNSVTTDGRSLALIHNQNVLAVNTTVLKLQQDADHEALSIDQNANGFGILIDTEATTQNAIRIADAKLTTAAVVNIGDTDALTTGQILRLHSNSATTNTRDLLFIHNQNTLATGARCLNIQQDAATRAVNIDQNAESHALWIDCAATTGGNAIRVDTPLATTTNVVNITACNSLTTGSALRVHSNSADTGTRNVAFIHNANSASINATTLAVRQDAAERVLFVDQNTNARGLVIDTEATSLAAIYIDAPTITTGRIVEILSANSLTSGSGFYIHSNSSDTGTYKLVDIHNDNAASTSGRCLNIVQDGDGLAISIDVNGNARAIQIISDATTAPLIDIQLPKITTNNIINVSNVNDLTTGNILALECGATGLSSGRMLDVDYTVSAASLTGKTGECVRIQSQRTETRATGTTADDYDTCLIFRNGINQTAGGTLTSAGSVLKVVKFETQIAGTHTDTALGIELECESRDAGDVYAMKITHDNLGAGNPGGIDMSSFAVDEPLLKGPSDAITSLGTLSHQMAVDIGGTTYYIPLYTTGT